MAAVIGYSVEELNYFRACYVTTRIFPDKLRTLFKQEWDNRYQATYGTWQDTAKNGIDFYNMESPKRQKINARELAVIRNGNTCKWDCTCLFYAILSSDSVGKGLDPAVRKSVDHLRQFRNYVVHIPDGKLNESDFNSNIKKVITAFASLKLSTAGIEDINTQRLFPAEELRDIKEQLEKKEMRCVLPTKPNHQVIDRSDEIREIHTQMERLRSTKPNEITVIYLSGNPGCGKSEIARQVGEKLFKDASDHATKIFVFTLNASSHDTLIQSYVEFAISLKCDNNFVTSIQMSKDLSQEDKLELLQSIVAPKLQNYSASWLIIVDNVTEVNSVLRYLPQVGEKTEGKGQMLVTTQDSISISPDDSYAYHLSLSKGMSRKDALRMLSEISNIVDEEETTFEIAKALDFQPLALALAANYMKCLRITTPTFSWKEYRENLKQGKRQATEGESKRISVAYSQTMTAAVRLAVEKEMADGVMKLAFHFLSVEASKLMPLESVVQYVKRLIPDEDEELVAAHITSSSLILSSQNQSKEIGVHQVVHSCLQILFKVS